MRQSGGQMCMTEGCIWRQLMILTIPVFLSQLLQQCYNMVDAAIVGQYTGPEGLAAVSAAGILMSLMVNFFVGISTGVSVVISQMFGAEEYNILKCSLHTAVATALLAGGLFQIAGLLFADTFLIWLDTPEEILGVSGMYLKVSLLGVIPQLLYNVGTAVLSALGNTRTPLCYLVFSSVLNLILDYIFVVQFHIGVHGAAAATVIAQCFSAVLVIRKLTTLDPLFRFQLRELRFHGECAKRLIKIGLPSGFQAVFMSASTILIRVHINSFGTDVIAGNLVFSKIEGFLYLPLFSLGIAVTSFMGQNAGAGRTDRIRQGMRISMGLGVGLWTVFCFVLMRYAHIISRLFTSDPEVIATAVQAVFYVFPSYAFYAVNQIYIGVIRGMGKTLQTMLITVCCYSIFRVMWCRMLLPFWHDMRIVYLSYSFSAVLMTVMLYFCCRMYLPESIKIK